MYRNRKRSDNDQYNETSNHIQMKGGDGRGPGLEPPGRGTRPCRRTLSFVYGLMSHCIDRFHFVFYLHTFHFMHPMCILEHIAQRSNDLISKLYLQSARTTECRNYIYTALERLNVEIIYTQPGDNTTIIITWLWWHGGVQKGRFQQ